MADTNDAAVDPPGATALPPAAAAAAPAIDLGALADKVYALLRDDIRLERARGGGRKV